MKKHRNSESRIISILKEAENGVPVAELSCAPSMRDASSYNSRANSGWLNQHLFESIAHVQKNNNPVIMTLQYCVVRPI